MTDEAIPSRSSARKELDRLIDIQDAIGNIQGHPRFGEGKKAWDEDQYYRGYCERQLGIIGEAASRLTAEFEYDQKHPSLPWRQIIALRNILVHMYWGSDPNILWGIIETHIPDLKGNVNVWIEERKVDVTIQAESERKSKSENKLSKRIRELAESGHDHDDKSAV